MLQILPYYHAQNQTELTSSAMCLFDWFKICHRLSLKKKGSQSFKQSPQSQDQSPFFFFFFFLGGGHDGGVPTSTHHMWGFIQPNRLATLQAWITIEKYLIKLQLEYKLSKWCNCHFILELSLSQFEQYRCNDHHQTKSYFMLNRKREQKKKSNVKFSVQGQQSCYPQFKN